MTSDQQQERIGHSGMTRRDTLRWLGAGGGAAAAGIALAACTSGNSSAAGDGAGNFPSAPTWKFVFVNHVTTNSFFVPTRTGSQTPRRCSACQTPQWTGSTRTATSRRWSARSTPPSTAARTASRSRSPTPTRSSSRPRRALGKGIPVIAYNATAPNNYPLAYVGQDLYQSGVLMGQRIAQDVTSGTILVGISQPGGEQRPAPAGRPHRRAEAGRARRDRAVRSTPAPEQAGELNAMTAAYTGAPDAKGLYAVDAGSTASIAQLITSRGLRQGARRRVRHRCRTRSRASGPARWTSPSTSPPTCRASCRAVPLPVPAVRHAGHAAADRHRPDVRHEGERRPVRWPPAGSRAGRTTT